LALRSYSPFRFTLRHFRSIAICLWNGQPLKRRRIDELLAAYVPACDKTFSITSLGSSAANKPATAITKEYLTKSDIVFFR
jgi:hypothetical protein